MNHHDPLCESLRPFPGSTPNPCNCTELAEEDYEALLNGTITNEEYRLLDSGLKLIEHVRAAERARNEGPGTPTARWLWLLEELEKRFPDPEPCRSDRTPEEHYLKAMDAQAEELRALIRELIFKPPNKSKAEVPGLEDRLRKALGESP
jgi:hypothetical protein